MHVNVNGLVDFEVELKKSFEKLKKLKIALAKLEVTISAPGFKTSAPLPVQEHQHKRAKTLRNEISQLEAYMKELSMLSKN